MPVKFNNLTVENSFGAKYFFKQASLSWLKEIKYKGDPEKMITLPLLATDEAVFFSEDVSFTSEGFEGDSKILKGTVRQGNLEDLEASFSGHLKGIQECNLPKDPFYQATIDPRLFENPRNGNLSCDEKKTTWSSIFRNFGIIVNARDQNWIRIEN